MELNGVKIEFLGHSGFVITTQKGKKIVIDPYNLTSYHEKADFILITHNHYDHCSIKDIKKIVKEGTIAVVPADAQSKIMKVDGLHMEIVEVGDEIELRDARVEIMPAYNVKKDFHPKREGWFGFVVKMGDVIVYHSGDSDEIPEMKRLTGYGKKGNKFVVLLPVSGQTVMNAEEAAEVANFLSPDVAIPMHYGAGVAGTMADAERFVELCKEMNINAEILHKI